MNGGWQVKGKNYKGCQGFELADHMNWGPLTKSSKAKPVFFCGRETKGVSEEGRKGEAKTTLRLDTSS